MKPFLTLDNQIALLKIDKDLIVDDIGYAKDHLSRIGYFGLIGGYKGAFRAPNSRRFIKGIRFEDIVNLYDFDNDLRALFLKYLLRVERSVKTQLAYSFSEQYGQGQSSYLDKANYTNNPKHQQGLKHLLDIMQAIATKSTDFSYLIHQRNKYSDVPLWALANAMTFGAISKFFYYSTHKIQMQVAKNYPETNRRQIALFLNVLTKYRNVCAHGERLYTYTTINTIADTTLHAKLGIAKAKGEYACGKRDLFAVVIALRYLLPDADFKAFKGSLQRIINRYLKSTTAITEVDLRRATGFPANWRSIVRYNK